MNWLQSNPGGVDIPILAACFQNYSFFVENYFLSSDSFRRKAMLTLAHIVSVYKGRPAAVSTLNFGLKNAKTDEDISTIIQFVRDIESWCPGKIRLAIFAYFLEIISIYLHVNVACWTSKFCRIKTFIDRN